MVYSKCIGKTFAVLLDKNKNSYWVLKLVGKSFHGLIIENPQKVSPSKLHMVYSTYVGSCLIQVHIATCILYVHTHMHFIRY